MENENITCEICNKLKWAFVNVNTEKGLFSKMFRVCVDCFKHKNIEEIITKIMENDANEKIQFHENKINEIKLRMNKDQNDN